MAYKAKVLYMFEAEAEGELTVTAGEIITVAEAGAGQGWVYATGASGQYGLVPESYIQQAGEAELDTGTEPWYDDFGSDEEPEGENLSSLVKLPRYNRVTLAGRCRTELRHAGGGAGLRGLVTAGQEDDWEVRAAGEREHRVQPQSRPARHPVRREDIQHRSGQQRLLPVAQT